MSSSEEFIVWKPEPNFRGTFGIIVTCFTTLGICVWSSLHLNIRREQPTWQQNLLRKLFWMLSGVFVPEVLITIASGQYLSAREIRDRVNQTIGFSGSQMNRRPMFGTENDKSKAEFLLADFSKATAQDSESTHELSLSKDKHLSLQDDDDESCQQAEMGQVIMPRKHVHRWTLVHGFYATMGGFVHQTQDRYGNVTRTVISPYGFIQLLEERPDLIPDISEEAILLKGKSDGLAKMFLIVQVGWFCINCIIRLAQGLPLTLLEVSAAAHAGCSLFVYALWWHKPLNVTVADTTDVPYAGISLQVRDEGVYAAENHKGVTKEYQTRPTLVAVFMAVGIIYGAPHFLAWNSSFATHTELLLWRICTCAVVTIPTFCGVFLVINATDGVSSFVENLGAIGTIISFLIYFPANLYIIAASLRQLFHLPPAAFKLPLWSNYFPHVS